MVFWIIWIGALVIAAWAFWMLIRSGRKPTRIAPPKEPIYYDDRFVSYDERMSYNRRWLEEQRRRQIEDDVLYRPVIVEPVYVPEVTTPTIPDGGGFSGFGGGDSGGAGASSDWSDSGSCDSGSSGSCDSGN